MTSIAIKTILIIYCSLALCFAIGFCECFSLSSRPCIGSVTQNLSVIPKGRLSTSISMLSSIDEISPLLTTITESLTATSNEPWFSSNIILSEASAPEDALSKSTTVYVFIVGIIPFAWATVEFWRRIAVGESFGSGKGSVVISIGEDDTPNKSRGRQTLGKGALVVAYILFCVAALSIFIAIASVLSTPPPPFINSATTATLQ